PSVREHFVVAVIYTLVGLYLGILYQISGTLWVPIGAHAFYDYLALLFLRYCYARTPAAG
ncbi:MAG TPA: CPBP family intramembrane metalloprotease, partial [Oligoflexia bacterium]|nr:CPBP family intramembrane metalloprotease [Oligoflexia bacterium]